MSHFLITNINVALPQAGNFVSCTIANIKEDSIITDDQGQLTENTIRARCTRGWFRSYMVFGVFFSLPFNIIILNNDSIIHCTTRMENSFLNNNLNSMSFTNKTHISPSLTAGAFQPSPCPFSQPDILNPTLREAFEYQNG